MGKNLDTDNIFGSYLNNVLLKEAVKPTGGEHPVPSNEVLKATRERLMRDRMTEVKKEAETSSTGKETSGKETSGIEGSWSGNSNGESISIKFGSNGSAILKNSAGANTGSWSSQDSDSFSVNFANQLGRMVLVDSSTASLTIGGNSIELKRGNSSAANTSNKKASPEPKDSSAAQAQPATQAPSRGKLTVKSLQNADELNNATDEEFIQLIKSLQTK